MKHPGRGAALAALPDGLTAGAFVAIWLSPFLFGDWGVRTALLTMLLEFFLIHATGFFTAFAMAPGFPRRLRIGAIVGLSAFYLLMIGVFALVFEEWWPLLAFAWLVVGKVAWASAPRSDAARDDAMGRGMAAWAGSGVAYLLGAFATALAPVPRLGMTEALQPGFGLGDDVGGLWLDEPQRVVAFGAVYFGLLFAGKLLAAAYAGKTRP